MTQQLDYKSVNVRRLGAYSSAVNYTLTNTYRSAGDNPVDQFLTLPLNPSTPATGTWITLFENSDHQLLGHTGIFYMPLDPSIVYIHTKLKNLRWRIISKDHHFMVNASCETVSSLI